MKKPERFAIFAIIISVFMASLLFMYGNLSIGAFYWHFIPEMLGLAFLGWFCRLKNFKFVVALFLWVAGLISGIVITRFTLLGIFSSIMLSLPFLLGYFRGRGK